ncbi:LOW QUALITY PROTEIN: hypothetical protein RIB2604_02100270 [Aspergillus luchuensis]|uniref:Uncharacterized protein n=1 Tax=Aspergillus kawachii TaxID=1069201 RepID=A0A146FMN1_ASPKA|nr:LOW QUALITY PROTEIN: hypothetical protein RIB2604_02100270 [Aspergillus luchuensis]
MSMGILIYFPEYHSHLILSGDDAADRTFWVQQFQDQPTGAPIQYKGQDQCAPGIIIATSRTSAQGLTLHRSKHIVLLEVSARHTQVWGYICRIGQKAPEVYYYFFTNDQTEEEQHTMHTNTDRQKLEQTVNTYD